MAVDHIECWSEIMQKYSRRKVQIFGGGVFFFFFSKTNVGAKKKKVGMKYNHNFPYLLLSLLFIL